MAMTRGIAASDTAAGAGDERPAAPGAPDPAELESYRRELTAYCYRMLGSGFEAEDAVQDVMVRAWRHGDRFEGRSTVRTWLYRIATNVCLDMLDGRSRRARPMDLGAADTPDLSVGPPLAESTWVRPVPDGRVVPDDADPAERAVLRESVRLALVAALQHLPPKQRTVLILCEVLRWRADEVAALLETTVASVNSALQRARAAVEQKLPQQSQQATLRALGDDGLSELVDRYVDAWERNDVDTVVTMLAEDSTFAMPPLATWFGGREEIAIFLAGSPMSGDWDWKVVRTRANGQPALAFYAWDPEQSAYLPFALNVLALEGEKVRDVTAFINRVAPSSDREVIARMPDHPTDRLAHAAAFEQFGLPERLD
jgi:RNA polymerase sigma-70 factor (ECF subfamily)